MPYIIEEKTVGLAWLKYIEYVCTKGSFYYDESDKIIEISDLIIKIHSNIIEDDILLRFANRHLEDLYLEKMQSCEIVEELNASYGKRIFGLPEVNQYEWCKSRLLNKPETKAATIALFLPNDPGPRIPCLTTIDFKLRNEVLDTKCFFRSQNAMNSYGNFRALFWLSNKMANDLGVKCGSITCFISNGHIYEKDIEKAKLILNSAKEVLL
ncbi:MAG: thymidylate synthase [Oscillospiraceae bacterium]|jgi:thymidylate synthase|nr:thymidylate synthase [Oscillospiraceae bacterium]